MPNELRKPSIFDDARKRRLENGKAMNRSKLPKTDSIQEVAAFWDTHDLSEFEDELEEVAGPVFVRGTAIKVPLGPREVKAVEQMAQAKGVSRENLIRTWVLQKIARRNGTWPTKR